MVAARSPLSTAELHAVHVAGIPDADLWGEPCVIHKRNAPAVAHRPSETPPEHLTGYAAVEWYVAGIPYELMEGDFLP